ncbi:hypothetical protein U1Q18_052344 [Sarracenia purpurea var. burkii]
MAPRCHFIHEGAIKSKPSALCLYPNNIPSASSLKDLSLSPNSMSSLSPANEYDCVRVHGRGTDYAVFACMLSSAFTY